jgi:hypothetical protein
MLIGKAATLQQSPTWESDGRSDSQEILRLAWNPRFHYCVHNSPSLDSILSQMNPFRTFTSYLRYILVLSPPTLPNFDLLLSFPQTSSSSNCGLRDIWNIKLRIRVFPLSLRRTPWHCAIKNCAYVRYPTWKLELLNRLHITRVRNTVWNCWTDFTLHVSEIHSLKLLNTKANGKDKGEKKGCRSATPLGGGGARRQNSMHSTVRHQMKVNGIASRSSRFNHEEAALGAHETWIWADPRVKLHVMVKKRIPASGGDNPAHLSCSKSLLGRRYLY